MIHISIKEKLNKDQVQALWEFCRKHADFLSLTAPHTGALSADQFAPIQKELKEELERHIAKLEAAYREERDKQGFACRSLAKDTRKQIKRDLAAARKQAPDILRGVQQSDYQGEDRDTALLASLGMVERKITCVSPVAIGPVMDICCFPASALAAELNSMTGLFQHPIEVGGCAFADPVFLPERI